MNDFNTHTSKIKRIIVALPNFHFFHQPSNEEISDERFIGRKKNVKKLENWIQGNEQQSKNNFSGSYLITGYRGMGKSSFVGHTINKIIDKPHKLFPRLLLSMICIIPYLATFCFRIFLFSLSFCG